MKKRLLASSFCRRKGLWLCRWDSSCQAEVPSVSLVKSLFWLDPAVLEVPPSWQPWSVSAVTSPQGSNRRLLCQRNVFES